MTLKRVTLLHEHLQNIIKIILLRKNNAIIARRDGSRQRNIKMSLNCAFFPMQDVKFSSSVDMNLWHLSFNTSIYFFMTGNAFGRNLRGRKANRKCASFWKYEKRFR